MSYIEEDEISLLYRKYIIKFIWPKNRFCYLIWGTDKSENDFLLANEQGKILSFRRIKDILKYITEDLSNLTPDFQRFKDWAKLYKQNRAYGTYSLQRIRDFTTSTITSIETIDELLLEELLDFYNLFTDFSEQTDAEQYESLQHYDDIDLFIDWINLQLLWDKSDLEYIEDLKKKLKAVDFKKIQKTFLDMITIFTDSLIIISYPNVD